VLAPHRTATICGFVQPADQEFQACRREAGQHHIDVMGIEGYTECSTSFATDCSFSVVDRSTTKLTVHAYAATGKFQRIVFFVNTSPLRLTQYGRATVTTNTCYTIFETGFTDCVSASSTTLVSRERTTAIAVINNPAQRQVSSATATPTDGRNNK
jgi:hypothetical protein